jgi:squalene synthase HpnC
LAFARRHAYAEREHFDPYNLTMHNGFVQELTRWGPKAQYGPLSRGQAIAYCANLARTHYENFSVATLLLPRRLVPHFHNIYAYCRWADDLGDETGGGQHALDLLQWWREELLHVYDGKPRHPVMVALRGTIERFAIPPTPFLELLLAFEQDQIVKRYDTYAQLLGYCRYSANPVGHLVLYLCECHDERTAGLSDAICTGLQLANFWQDVARDLDIGRVYLPAEDRRRFGFSDADLEARRCTPAFVELMRFEVERARQLFAVGLPLISLVPPDVQADIELFARGGLGILSKIETLGYDVWRTRPALHKWEKAALLGSVFMRNWARQFWNGRSAHPQPLSPKGRGEECPP